MSTCRKKTFPLRADAGKEALKLARINGHLMREYQCDQCGHWHLTSQDLDGHSHKVLQWGQVERGYLAAPSEAGYFHVYLHRGGWIAEAPDGRQIGPTTLAEAKQWADSESIA